MIEISIGIGLDLIQAGTHTMGARSKSGFSGMSTFFLADTK